MTAVLTGIRQYPCGWSHCGFDLGRPDGVGQAPWTWEAWRLQGAWQEDTSASPCPAKGNLLRLTHSSHLYKRFWMPVSKEMNPEKAVHWAYCLCLHASKNGELTAPPQQLISPLGTWFYRCLQTHVVQALILPMRKWSPRIVKVTPGTQWWRQDQNPGLMPKALDPSTSLL